MKSEYYLIYICFLIPFIQIFSLFIIKYLPSKFYYHKNSLHGVRYGDYKMYFPHRYRTLNGRKGRNDGIPIKYEYVNLEKNELYNLRLDPAESTNIIDKFPEIVKKIEILANKKREEIGDDLLGIEGSEKREVGLIE